MRRTRISDRATWLGAASCVLVALTLLVAALFLADTQREQRAALRDRYADRVVVAGALLDALLRTAFLGQTAGLTQTLGGSRVPTAALEARASADEARWTAVIDRSGRILGRSASAPLDEVRRLAARPYVERAFGGGYALGDVETGLLRTAVRFPARSALAGSRALVSAAPPASLSRFLEGALVPLPGVSGARAYILDGGGAPIAGLARATIPTARVARLVRALRERPTGWFDDGSTRRFFASEAIPRSGWRLVVTVPERAIYASVSGASRWVPWIILGLFALALVGVGVLLRRLLAATRAMRGANRDLSRSNAELERSNGDLEQFASVASHDLSEPLRTVAGFSQLLQRRYGDRLDDEADLYLHHMVDGVHRMQQLIDDLLVYARVGRAPPCDDPVDLDEVLDDVLRTVEHTVRERGAVIHRGALPTVCGERGQFEQVLQNLVVNAMKFTPPDTAPEIDVEAHRERTAWRLDVRDNGIGVPPGQRETIFKMFGRLHPNEAYPGTGIGLALVKRIVEGHGGVVWVSERLDGRPGSVFSFTLPDRTPAAVHAAPRRMAA